MIQGHIFNEDDENIKLYIKNTPENIAVFIYKCPVSADIVLVDTGDCLVLNTSGNVLNYCRDTEFKNKISSHLSNLQQGKVKVPKVEFDYDEECYNSKEVFIDFVLQNTGYSL